MTRHRFIVPAFTDIRVLLSRRQLQVLQLYGCGHMQSEIGAALGIARVSVETHLDLARIKLGQPDLYTLRCIAVLLFARLEMRAPTP